MAKVAVLVPNQELELIAQPLTEEFSSLQVMEVKYIRTAYAVQRARELEQQGCDLIVARGVQARLIKRSVRIPLVEITVTPQELASVMLDLKEELELDCPRIGLIGFPNMFSDTSQFNRLLHIDLRCSLQILCHVDTAGCFDPVLSEESGAGCLDHTITVVK